MRPRSTPSADEKFPTLEGLNDDEAIAVIIEKLGKIDKDVNPGMYGTEGIETMSDLIDHVQKKTPVGLKLLGLWRRAEETIKEVKDAQPVSAANRIRKFFGECFN